MIYIVRILPPDNDLYETVITVPAELGITNGYEETDYAIERALDECVENNNVERESLQVTSVWQRVR